MKSEYFVGSAVSFPEFTGERVHMREFIPTLGLPKDLERWQETVDAMLVGVNAPGSVYLMIDQGDVKAGTCHRRPGLHVDGYWSVAQNDHGQRRHTVVPDRPIQKPTVPVHIHPSSIPDTHQFPTRHSFGAWEKEALILASTVDGCEVFSGEWGGNVRAGGDCDHITRNNLKSEVMRLGVAWLGETGSMLHSAMVLSENVRRTVVRLNVPGWYPV